MANFAPIKYAGKRFLRMVSGDKITPTFIPVSTAAGNNVQSNADGLYVGNVLTKPQVFIASNGTDAPASGTISAPYKTLDYAIAQVMAAAGPMRGYDVAFVLKAGETFQWTKRVGIKANITFGWFGDPKYGKYDDPLLNQVTNRSYMDDLQRPIIAVQPELDTVTNIWRSAGFDLYASPVILSGVRIELPNNPPQVSQNDFSIFDVFVPFDNSSIELQGTIVNKPNTTSFGGLIGITASEKASLSQMCSQFLIAGVMVKDATNPAALQIREHFIHMYNSATSSNSVFIPMFPSASNSSPGSGILEVMWTDAAALPVPSFGNTQATFPIQTTPSYGLRYFINNLRLDPQSRPLNVISGRQL